MQIGTLFFLNKEFKHPLIVVFRSRCLNYFPLDPKGQLLRVSKFFMHTNVDNYVYTQKSLKATISIKLVTGVRKRGACL